MANSIISNTFTHWFQFNNIPGDDDGFEEQDAEGHGVPGVVVVDDKAAGVCAVVHPENIIKSGM